MLENNQTALKHLMFFSPGFVMSCVAHLRIKPSLQRHAAFNGKNYHPPLIANLGPQLCNQHNCSDGLCVKRRITPDLPVQLTAGPGLLPSSILPGEQRPFAWQNRQPVRLSALLLHCGTRG